MPLLGSAAMLLSFDVTTDAIDEHDRWHTQEHLPERLSVPGFRRGTRWVATNGGSRYMVLYEVETLQTLSSTDYLFRLNNPTPWTTKMMPHYRNMRRGLCAVLSSFGFGQGGQAALIRFTPEQSRGDGLHGWLAQTLASYSQLSGLGSAHVLQRAQAAAMTNEQRIRGADGGIDSAVIITGYDSKVVAAAAQALCGSGGLPGCGGTEVSCSTYQMSYSLASTEVDA
jgi:hypothetical protein